MTHLLRRSEPRVLLTGFILPPGPVTVKVLNVCAPGWVPSISSPAFTACLGSGRSGSSSVLPDLVLHTKMPSRVHTNRRSANGWVGALADSSSGCRRERRLLALVGAKQCCRAASAPQALARLRCGSACHRTTRLVPVQYRTVERCQADGMMHEPQRGLAEQTRSEHPASARHVPRHASRTRSSGDIRRYGPSSPEPPRPPSGRRGQDLRGPRSSLR